MVMAGKSRNSRPVSASDFMNKLDIAQQVNAITANAKLKSHAKIFMRVNDA